MHLPDNWKKLLSDKLKALLIIIFVYYAVTWFTGCPIRFLTGISCPGCGMTRAWISLLHLDLAGAFAFHPLFWTAPLIAAVFLLEDWIDWKRFQWIIVLPAVLFLIVYLIRMFQGAGDVVVFEPKKGLILRSILFIFR